MRRLLAIMLIGCLALLACEKKETTGGEPAAAPAAEAPQPGTETPAAPAEDASSEPASAGTGQPSRDAPQTQDDAGVQAAAKLIAEMGKVYQSAPAMTDRMILKQHLPGSSPPDQEHTLVLGMGRDVRITGGSYEIIVIGDDLYFTLYNMPDRYLRADLEEDMLITTQKVLRGRKGGGIGALQCALRYGKTMDEILQTMTLGMSAEMKLSGLQIATEHSTGKRIAQIKLESDNGRAIINVDPETKLLISGEVAVTPPEIGSLIGRSVTFNPVIHDKLPTPITFDPSGRFEVSSLKNLHGRYGPEDEHPKLTMKPGEAMPDFALTTLAGEQVTLSDFEGSVVVLAFWASWCSPCFSDMPAVQEFAALAESEGWPVHVLGVNIMERGDTDEQKLEQARRLWQQWKMLIPSIIDIDGELIEAYGVRFLPTKLVIGPDGRLFSAHGGEDKNLVQSLQHEVQGAMLLKHAP